MLSIEMQKSYYYMMNMMSVLEVEHTRKTKGTEACK